MSFVTSLLQAKNNSPELVEWRLNNQQLQWPEAEAIAQVLANNPNLQTLDVSNNPIGDKGALLLVKMLERNCGLHSLDMDRVMLSEEGKKACSDAIINSGNKNILVVSGIDTAELDAYLVENRRVAGKLLDELIDYPNTIADERKSDIHERFSALCGMVKYRYFGAVERDHIAALLEPLRPPINMPLTPSTEVTAASVQKDIAAIHERDGLRGGGI